MPVPVARFVVFFTFLTGLAATSFFAVILYSYGVLDTYLDHAEPSVVIRAWRLVSGQELYPPLDAADYLLIGYGPSVFLSHSFFLSLFGGSIPVSKLVGIAAASLSVAVFAVHVFRNFGVRYLGIAITLFVGICIHLAPFTFWTRPDPQMILLVTGALFAASLPRDGAGRWLSLLGVGICLGLAVNLKVHTVIYFVPIFVRFFPNRWLVHGAQIGLIGAAVALLPFAHPQISLFNYVDGLTALTIGREVLYEQLFAVLRRGAPLFLFPGLLLPFLIRSGLWRREIAYFTTLALCVGVTLYPSSLPGAGWYHMLPFLPVTVDVFLRMARDIEDDERVSLGASLLVATAFVILMIVPGKRMVRSFERLAADTPASEVREILRRHPGSSFDLGIGQDVHNYGVTFVRPVVAFAGFTTIVSGWSEMESLQLRLPPPPAKLAWLETCRSDFWLIPKNERPFDMSSYYYGKRTMWPPFRDAFIKSYEKRESYRYFDLWGCRGAGTESKS